MSHKTRPVWAVAIVLVALAVTACGSSSKSSSSSATSAKSAATGTTTSGTGGAPPKPINITFVESVAAAAAPQVTLAQELGIFKKVGLNVKHLYVGANIASTVVSGQAQIGNLGAAGIVSVAQAGKPTTAIWASLGNAIAGMLVTKASITSLSQLESLPSCKYAALTPGTSNYGWASHHIATIPLPHCKIIDYNSDPAIVGACASGEVDACGGLADEYVPLQAQGKVHILIDTRSAADRAKYIGPSFSDVVYWGMTSWIKSHPVAVDRFIEAMNLTDKALHTDPTATLAAALHKDSNFATQSIAQLESELKNDVAYWNTPDHGYISQANWDTGLKNEASWGIKGFNPKAAVSQYSARVDMSYYDKVVGKPAGQ